MYMYQTRHTDRGPEAPGQTVIGRRIRHPFKSKLTTASAYEGAAEVALRWLTAAEGRGSPELAIGVFTGVDVACSDS
jgi:hypothetical protein